LFAVATFLWSGSQKAPQQPSGNKNKKTEEQFYVDMGPHKKPIEFRGPHWLKGQCGPRSIGNGMDEITWQHFEMVELRVGTVIKAEPYPQARKPAYKIWADFGPEIGVKKSSAQVTVYYTPEELVGRQIIGVVNFPVKQIGPFRSEFLLTGFVDATGAVVLAMPERQVPDGAKLC